MNAECGFSSGKRIVPKVSDGPLPAVFNAVYIGKCAIDFGVDRVMRDDIITVLRPRIRALYTCLSIQA